MTAIREHRIELGGFETRAVALDGGAADAPAMERRGRRAVALDMPGFGQAARLDREASILPQLDVFAAAAIEREAERSADGEVIVAGNSLGGCVALRAAQYDALPVAGVVPVAPAGLEMARWVSIIEREAPLRWLMRSPLPVPE